MSKTLAQLTKTQQAAYKALLEAGKLESGDVRTATIEVLEREGFVTVERTSVKTRRSTRNGVQGGTRTTWVAYAVIKDEAPEQLSLEAKPGAKVTILDGTANERTAEVFKPHWPAKPSEATPAKTPHGPTLVRLVKTELGFERANMPEHGGFAVTKVLWDMIPVFLVHWAYEGRESDGTPSNMIERTLSDEVRKMAELFKSKGYVVRSTEDKNHFFVVPEEFRHTHLVR